ncbi:MAG: trigger factor [Phycisphaerae bacterium]
MTDEDVVADQEDTVEDQEDSVADQEEQLSEDEREEELSEEEQAMAKLKEAIAVEREEIGSLHLKLTVTIPEEALDERRGEQFAELKRDADIPGFRKGHAPLTLVEKRFATDVGETLKSQLIGSGYLAAVEKEELKPLGDPLFWVRVKEERIGDDGKPHKVETEKLLPIDQAVDNLSLPKQGPLTFSCELELKPEFELPELTKIPVKRTAISIDDDDVEAELKRMRVTRGTFQPVEDGEVEADDLLYADMKMSVDGEVIASEESFELAARDLRVKGVPLVGFGDAVVGRTLGDGVAFEAPVPDDHENIDTRGKTAQFEFVIREIKRLEVPPLDEEFLSVAGFESEEELRSTLRSSLESHLDETIKRAMHEQIGAYLIDNTTLEIPEGLSQRQTDRSVARRMIEMYQMGAPQTEIEKMMDELRARAHDQAVRDLKLFFILEKIAEERKIEVNEEQVNSAIAQIAQRSNKRFDRVRDELSKGNGMMTLYLQLRDRQVLEALLEDAEITETEGPKKKASAKKATAKKATAKKASEKKSTKKTTKKKASKESS